MISPPLKWRPFSKYFNILKQLGGKFSAFFIVYIQTDIILDRLNINRDIDTTFSLSSATHRIDMEIIDEFGNALIPTNWSNGNGIGFMLQTTQGSRYPYSTLTATGIPATSMMITDIPSSMKVLLGREIAIPSCLFYKEYISCH